MPPFDPNTVIMAGIPLVCGGAVWLIRLEGQVKLQRAMLTRFVDQLDSLDKKFDDFTGFLLREHYGTSWDQVRSSATDSSHLRSDSERRSRP
jgi:hypothetical protein